jgi:MFS family permease
MTTGIPRHILPVIVASQLAGTSIWFAGNAVLPDLIRRGGLPPETIGDVTSAVQAGFIAGTMVFAVLMLADRFSPRRIFLLCALLGAAFNVAVVATGAALWPLLGLRFAAGFCLAGIYPVGMKIAAGWFDRDLGRALGWLVGALVVGTALPHLIRGLGGALPWQGVVLATSAIAAAGGLLMFALVPDGPHLRPGMSFDAAAISAIFRAPDFRASSFGYFGHMWELYAFWAFVPVWIATHGSGVMSEPEVTALISFAIIAAGGIGCIAGGMLSRRLGSARVAMSQIVASGLCCLVSPLAFLLPAPALVGFLLVWGIVVVGDSPQFSTLNAQNAPPRLVGSALTIANCIGFAISIVSIRLLSALHPVIGSRWLFLVLLPGPILGALALRRLTRGEPPHSRPH